MIPTTLKDKLSPQEVMDTVYWLINHAGFSRLDVNSMAKVFGMSCIVAPRTGYCVLNDTQRMSISSAEQKLTRLAAVSGHKII